MVALPEAAELSKKRYLVKVDSRPRSSEVLSSVVRWMNSKLDVRSSGRSALLFLVCLLVVALSHCFAVISFLGLFANASALSALVSTTPRSPHCR